MSKLGAQATRQKRLSQAALAPHPAPEPSKFERFSPHPTISGWNAQATWNELDWNQIQSILQSAERGFVDVWADFTRRMLKSDDHLTSVYNTYIRPVAAARREVTPAKAAPHEAELAKLQAADCEEMLAALPNIERTLAELLDADFTGYAVHEIIWKPKGDWIWPTDLVWLHPRSFRFSDSFELYLYANGRGSERAKQLGIETQLPGLPLSRDKYVIHIPRLIPDYPTSSGLLIPCVRPWFVKSWVTRFWMSGAEVAGNPRLLGKLPDNAPAAVREELYQALASLSADGTGVLSGGTDVVLLDPKAQGTGSVWETLLKRQDAAYSKAILGSTLNVEVGDTGGNRSLGESQADMTMAPRWQASARLLANTIETHLFRPFLEFNAARYGGRVFVPSLSLHIVEDEPAVDDIAINAGVVTRDELRRSRKLEPLGPENGGDELVSAPGLPLPPSPAIPLPESPSPAVVDGAAPGAEKASDTALNGAQVTSLLQIVEKVASGLIPRDTGVQLITAAFPISAEKANAIMGTVGAGFVPTLDSEPGPVPGGAATALPLPQTSALRASLNEARIATRTTSR